MKSKLYLMLICLSFFSFSAVAGNYVVTIDGSSHDVDLDKPSTITLKDGQQIKVVVEKKDILTFKTENMSFGYPSRLNPARTDLGEGIYQTMLVSPLGTLVLIQEYENLDPSSIVDLMLKELTKEENQYGYKIVDTETSKTANGIEYKGKKAVSTYKGEEITRYVLTYSARDSGLLIVTMIDKEAPPGDVAMLEKFWETLKVTME